MGGHSSARVGVWEDIPVQGSECGWTFQCKGRSLGGHYSARAEVWVNIPVLGPEYGRTFTLWQHYH